MMYAGRIVETAAADDLYRDGRHPYTHALLASVPKIVGPIAHRLESIAGQPPAPSDGTGGCAFAPRCPRRTERCDERPPLSGDERTRNSHLFACWNPL